MTDVNRPDDTPRTTPPNTWAPWWLYLLVLLGANYLRAAVVPDSSLPLPIIAAIVIAQAAVLFVIVTVIWRATHRGSS